jgi:hypothetical protein
MQIELEHTTYEFTFIQIWFRDCFYTVSSNNHSLDFRDNQKLNALYTNIYFILLPHGSQRPFQRRIWGLKIIHVVDATGETSANNSSLCMGTAKKCLSRVHLSHLFSIQFSWYPGVDAYTCGHSVFYSRSFGSSPSLFLHNRTPGNSCNSFIPLLQIYHCNTASSFFC